MFIPTTDCDTNNAFLLYCPIRTVLSENASITGRPAIVLTENNEPDNESSTENKRPDVPSTVNTPDPLPRNTSEDDAFEDDIIKGTDVVSEDTSIETKVSYDDLNDIFEDPCNPIK